MNTTLINFHFNVLLADKDFIAEIDIETGRPANMVLGSEKGKVYKQVYKQGPATRLGGKQFKAGRKNQGEK